MEEISVWDVFPNLSLYFCTVALFYFCLVKLGCWIERACAFWRDMKQKWQNKIESYKPKTVKYIKEKNIHCINISRVIKNNHY